MSRIQNKISYYEGSREVLIALPLHIRLVMEYLFVIGMEYLLTGPWIRLDNQGGGLLL